MSDSSSTQSWRQRLSQLPSSRNIGLAWAGNPANEKDRLRSIDLCAFAPLAEARGVRFLSLQKGAAGGQAQSPPRGMELVDWSVGLNDFADTAALIDALDLVICVDTAVAHLAGALGKPVWLLLPFGPDWRWLLARADSPWYPTMRIFRQTRADDWQGPMQEISRELLLSP
jgi:ADP-heptose:LPS heptosyltransferase